MFGTLNRYVPSYLDEFIWRRRFVKHRDAFCIVQEHIALKMVSVILNLNFAHYNTFSMITNVLLF